MGLARPKGQSYCVYALTNCREMTNNGHRPHTPAFQRKT